MALLAISAALAIVLFFLSLIGRFAVFARPYLEEMSKEATKKIDELGETAVSEYSVMFCAIYSLLSVSP